MALKYGELVLKDDSVLNNPKNYVNMCHNIIEQLIFFKRYNKALEYVEKMLEIARRDKMIMNRVKHDASCSLAHINKERGDRGKALRQLNEAINACQDADYSELQKNLVLSKYYQLKVAWLSEAKAYADALQNALAVDSITNILRKYRGGSYPDRMPEIRFLETEAISTCLLAKAYHENGDVERARNVFKRIENSAVLEKEIWVILKAVDYLMIANDNEKAIKLTLPIAASEAYDDSINSRRFDACRTLTDLYMRRGDLKNASKYASTAFMLNDSLKRRDNENEALELATLLETNEKEKMIEIQREELDRNRVLTYSALVMLVLSIVIIGVISFSSRAMAKKNRLMAKQIESGLAYRDELLAAQAKLKNIKDVLKRNIESEDDSCPTETNNAVKGDDSRLERSVSEEDGRYFKELDMKIRSERLYLDPDLTRDKILQLININKNRLSPMIQAFTGENLNGYINGLRLEYSLKLLKENDNYTIEAVAMDSGFNNIRTYQRLFRNKYGMSPAQFKKSLE